MADRTKKAPPVDASARPLASTGVDETSPGGVIELNLTPRAVVTALVALAAGVAVLAVATGRLALPTAPDIDQSASLWLVAFTGLSVGGLSCLAVQGGLLAAMIAHREAHLQGAEVRTLDRVAPIAQFLTAKVLAYTLLGALLGYFGSKIPLGLQGWMMIAAGVFMVLTVLQMYDVHPLLRRLVPTPPKPLQRSIRREAKRSDALQPWLLGAMTVFIPCGVTLAMEFLAIASNSAVRGATIMMAFTLGTVPTFLVVGVLATQLSRTSYRVFRPLAAVAVVAIALMSMIAGARLLGIGVGGQAGPGVEATIVEPSTAGSLPAGAGDDGVAAPASGAAEGSRAPAPASMLALQEATLQVSTGHYEPARVQVRPDMPTRLNLVTNNTQGCIRAFVIPSMGIEKMLPATGTEVVELPPVPAGTTIPFMCSMGMYTGVIEVSG